MNTIEPPRPLSIEARRTWDRHVARIEREGRIGHVDHDLLAVFCETIAIYVECKTSIEEHGVLVRGRTEHELVRNPALTPLSQARADLVRIAKAIPLVDSRVDVDAAAVDALLADLQ